MRTGQVDAFVHGCFCAFLLTVGGEADDQSRVLALLAPGCVDGEIQTFMTGAGRRELATCLEGLPVRGCSGSKREGVARGQKMTTVCLQESVAYSYQNFLLERL